MELLSTLRHPRDQGVTLSLNTLTPLYTGGIGQHGEQVHPSGLLGSLRSFSCLLAAAVGDQSFEPAVWGLVAPRHQDSHAKTVALRWDTQTLRRVTLPSTICWPRQDHQERRGWFFNTAHEGDLTLSLTRRGIGDAHWRLLLLALRIQIRHATLGAKDQYGLGVLTGQLPKVDPLDAPVGVPADRPGLHRAVFAEVRFDSPCPRDMRPRLEAGLRLREALRGAFRGPGQDDLRHYLFGHLGRGGSAINVSALYPLNDQRCALRVWGVAPHTVPDRFRNQREAAMGRVRHTLTTFQDYQHACLPELAHWRDSGQHQDEIAPWINHLAGVAP